MKQRGRPRSEETMETRITIRLDNVRKKLLDDYCEKNKASRAEAIRKGIDMLLKQEKDK